MKYILFFLFISLIVVGFNSTAIAKKHHTKIDSTAVDTIKTTVTTPSTTTNNADDSAGKVLGMSILGFIFLLWILPSIVPAIIASSKGRSGLGIFLLSIFLTPLVGLIVALLMQSAKKTTV